MLEENVTSRSRFTQSNVHIDALLKALKAQISSCLYILILFAEHRQSSIFCTQITLAFLGRFVLVFSVSVFTAVQHRCNQSTSLYELSCTIFNFVAQLIYSQGSGISVH